MKTKRMMAVILTGLMICMVLAGCSSKNEQSTKTAQSLKETLIETKENNPAKVLVVYYSATGNTEKVAKAIAEEAGGDLFELVPTQIYASDDLYWQNKDSRVSKEHDNPELRDVELIANTVENWEDYDTVFIGYPIWWWVAAWPVNSFVQLNDFSGKTVIPFATSTSSGIGDSGELLEQQAGSGNWQEGKRFQSGVSDDEVKEWVQDLKLQD